jgi:hypothetical protein
MKKEGKLMKFVEGIFNFADEHQREIFLGVQIVGTVTTAVLCWKAAPKAEEILEKHKKKMAEIAEDDKEGRKKETIDTVKDMAPVVVPPVAMGAMTIACALGGYKASTRQIAALSAAYSLSEKALTDFKDKTLDLIGPKKYSDVEENVARQRIDDNPPCEQNTILNTGRGTVKFLDPVSGRYFYSRPDDVRRAVNVVNNNTNVDGYFTKLNEFYDELGIPTIELGNMVGFHAGKLIDIDHIFSVILGENDEAIYVLNYEVQPGHGWFYE